MNSKQLHELTLEDIRRYFSVWRIESNAEDIVRDAVSCSLEKVHKAVQFLPSDDGGILQLGASPFFLSSVLSRFGRFQLTLAEYDREPKDRLGIELPVTLWDSYRDTALELTYRLIDVEQTQLPYPDESYDGIILYDLLHRFIMDPVFVFSEIYRVLKPGGWLLLCTPNAVFYGNLVKIWLARNIFSPYSTQGIIDRESRLFTIPEIADLMKDLEGFAVERLEGHDLRGNIESDWRMRVTKLVVRLVKRSDLNAEYIYCLVRKRGNFRSRWPFWLYKTYNPEQPQQNRPLDRLQIKLPETPPGPSRFERRICKLCDIKDWYGAKWLAYLDKMGETFGGTNYQRKAWEWAQGAYALDHLGLLNEEATALGVGVGTEQIIFFLANNIKKVIATDIYGEGSFAGLTAYEDMLTAPEKYAKIKYRKDHLEVRHMDGTKLDFPDYSFDFTFSFSSIEHFGGHSAAATAVKEMGRVTKPGGAVVITTEVILNGLDHEEFFRPSDLTKYLVEYSDLILLEDIDYLLSDETIAATVDFSHANRRYVNPQVICRLNGVYWTSVCLVLIKEAP